MAENSGHGQLRDQGASQMPDVLEIEFEELDDICGGVVANFGRGMQPDGAGARAHH